MKRFGKMLSEKNASKHNFPSKQLATIATVSRSEVVAAVVEVMTTAVSGRRRLVAPVAHARLSRLWRLMQMASL